MLNQSCIMCKQLSSAVLCGTCSKDIVVSIKSPPSPSHPLLIDMQTIIAANDFNVLGWYQWPIDTLIHLIKFKQRVGFCRLLAHGFIRYALPTHDLPDAIIPMPSSWWKSMYRGYNTPSILSQMLGKKLDIPLLNNYLKVGLTATSQHHLSRTKRIDKHHGFYCSVSKPTLTHVALVDDVITTGSTMRSAIKALRQQNPDLRISVWCMGITSIGDINPSSLT